MFTEKKKYILISAYTDKIDAEYDTRVVAEAAKAKKERAGDFSWRVRMVRYVEKD